jgi:hypothetical protein
VLSHKGINWRGTYVGEEGEGTVMGIGKKSGRMKRHKLTEMNSSKRLNEKRK